MVEDKIPSSKLKITSEKNKNMIQFIMVGNCTEKSWGDNYIAASGRRLVERVKDHGGGDNKLHILKNSIVKMHTEVELINFKIIVQNYNSKYKGKVSDCQSSKTDQY